MNRVLIPVAIALIAVALLFAGCAKQIGTTGPPDTAAVKETTPSPAVEKPQPPAEPAKTQPEAAAPSKAEPAIKDSVKEPEAAKPVKPQAAAAKPKGLPKLVDLGAEKCVPCKMMVPVLEELRSEYKGSLLVEVIDTGKDPEAARRYRVVGIPTQVFYDASGKEIARHMGFISKEDIVATFGEHGIKL